MDGLRRALRRPVALGAMTLAVLALSSVPAGRPAATLSGPLRVAGATDPRLRVLVALPRDFVVVAGLDGTAQVADGDGLATCRTVLSVAAEASARGIRFDRAARRLTFREGGARRTLTRARQLPGAGAERQAFAGDPGRARVGSPPVVAVVRFATPIGAPFASTAPATLIRASVDTFADTSSIVQRTPELFERCRRQTLRTGPAALAAVAGSAELVTVGAR